MEKFKIGEIIEGTVVRVYPRYAILLFDGNRTGLLHISELSEHYIRSFPAIVKAGNIYKVKVISYDEDNGFMHVSIKALTPEERKAPILRSVVPETEISSAKLLESLPAWIKEENEGDR